MSTPRYKLIYFNFLGLGEPLRFMFHLAGVPFEDIRVEVKEWKNGKKKGETCWGVLPELQVDGKTLCQSKAINYYLAKKFGFAGKDEWENAKVLEFLCSLEDVFGKLRAAFFLNDEAAKHETFKAIVNDDIRAYYNRLTKSLGENGTGYFVGDQLTVADIYIFVWLNGIDESWAPGLLEKYPKLKTFVERINNVPKIREWIEIRPKCPFAYIEHRVDINE
ncbi:glutathione S-transferase 1 [Ditylenchus destructor]|uniref:Glutathione S-transferase 1 n=1 Tax=Ditylenchus destructor TaxID=166010 RepID=A0AAD4QTA4_9BILA|nr:glutathione S-transferase 1 [Ditylenchus destructor]